MKKISAPDRISSADGKVTVKISVSGIGEASFSVAVTAIKDGKEIYTSTQSLVYFYSCEKYDFINYYTSGEAKDMYYRYMIAEKLVDERDVKWSYEVFVDEKSYYEYGSESIYETKSLLNITVQGYVKWTDNYGNLKPCKNVEVRIYDTGTFSNYLIRTVYTDASGFYSATFPNDMTPEENGYDIYVHAYARNTSVNVVNSSGITYFTSTPTDYDVPSSPIPLVKNISIPNTGANSELSYHVHQAANMAAEFMNLLEGSFLPSVNVQYPSPKSQYSNNVIYLNQIDYMYWDVIQHEYGHHVQRYYNITDSPGGDHHYSYNLADSYGKSNGIKLAWGEGWATYFPIWVQDAMGASSLGIPYVGDTGYKSSTDTVNVEARTAYGYGNLKYGEANELCVAAILLDIADGNNETYDQVYFGYQTVWDIVKNNNCYTLSQFIYNLYNVTNNDQKLRIGRILEEHGVAAMPTTPVGSTLNSSNRTFTWSAGGGSSVYPNNSFKISFYNSSFTKIYETYAITNTSYTLTLTELSTILNGTSGSTIYWCVIATQSSTPSTGPYISYYRTIYK